MCAINPKRERHFILSVYTTVEMTKEQFDHLAAEKAVIMEAELNQDMRLRWHVKDK